MLILCKDRSEGRNDRIENRKVVHSIALSAKSGNLKISSVFFYERQNLISWAAGMLQQV